MAGHIDVPSAIASDLTNCRLASYPRTKRRLSTPCAQRRFSLRQISRAAPTRISLTSHRPTNPTHPAHPNLSLPRQSLYKDRVLIFCSSVVSIYREGLPMPLFISCREGVFSETGLPTIMFSETQTTRGQKKGWGPSELRPY